MPCARCEDYRAGAYSFETAWAQYATNLVRGIALPCGHYPAEQAADETGAELSRFFGP